MLSSYLTIKAEAAPGDDLRKVAADMARLAKRTGCRVELKANGATFWATPEDSPVEMERAFDRLYSHNSRYVATHIQKPVMPPRWSPPPPFPGNDPSAA